MHQLSFEMPDEAKSFLNLKFLDWILIYDYEYAALFESVKIPGFCIHFYKECDENRIPSRNNIFIPIILSYDYGTEEQLLEEILKIDSSKEVLYALDLFKFMSAKLFPK